MTQDSDTLGSRLRVARQTRRWTQKEAGTAMGVAQQSFAQWENDRREISITMLKKLAKAYGVTAGWLLGEGPFLGDAHGDGSLQPHRDKFC